MNIDRRLLRRIAPRNDKENHIKSAKSAVNYSFLTGSVRLCSEPALSLPKGQVNRIDTDILLCSHREIACP